MKPFLALTVLATLTLAACADTTPGKAVAAETPAVEAKVEAPAEVKAGDAAAVSAHPGAAVYQNACMACHAADGKPTSAPPIFAVKDHLIKALPERDAFVKRVVDWVKAPNADDVLMPGAVRKFGLMPAQAHLSDADLQAVGEFLFDTDLGQPDWYKEHYQAEHGTKP